MSCFKKYTSIFQVFLLMHHFLCSNYLKYSTTNIEIQYHMGEGAGASSGSGGGRGQSPTSSGPCPVAQQWPVDAVPCASCPHETISLLVWPPC